MAFKVLVGDNLTTTMLEEEWKLSISQKRRLAGAKGGSAKVPKGLSDAETYKKAFAKRKEQNFFRSCFKKH